MAYGTAAPQLGVAEFAPAARNAIEPPPTTSDPSARNHAGAAGRRSTTTTVSPSTPTGPDTATTASAPTTLVGRARPCYGNPPRQTEDPMSPPCIPTIFEGDNGGATATGVSATEIRVGIPGLDGSPANVQRQAVDALFDHVNRSFELYGRRLVPVYVPGAGYTDALPSRALGTDVAGQGVFAALTGITEASGYVHIALPQELARNGIVTVARNATPWWSDRTLFDTVHPLAWSVYPSAEDLLTNLADFACRSLAGHPAAFAADSGLHSTTRKIGVISMGRQSPPAIGPALDVLRGCDQEPPSFVWNRVDDPSSTSLRTSLIQLRDSGATTVICACQADYAYVAVRDAAGMANFRPEWLISIGYRYSEQLAQTPTYAAPYVALEPGPRALPQSVKPWFTAMMATNPGLLTSGGSNLQQAFFAAQALYESLLVLASGIQAAGPAITADTFAAGLMSTQFPNPGAGAAPFWQPTAGFGPGDHAFYDDYAVAWWSNTATAVDPSSPNPQGSWCFLGQGTRYRTGSYPTDAQQRLFDANLPCR